jgi:ABC-type multidrug transport system fused ATPase/permease subunit
MIEFWLKLWHLSRPYKGRFVLGLVFGVLCGLMDTLVLLTLAFVFGVVFVRSREPSIDQLLKNLPAWLASAFVQAQHWVAGHVQGGANVTLLLVVGMIPLVMLARGVCSYLTSYLMGWVALRALCDLRVRLFEHLLNLPASFLTRNSTGELMSRVGDVNVLQSMIGVSMVTIIQQPISILTKLILLCMVSLKWTLIALVGLPFCVIPVAVYNRKMRRAGAGLQTEAANLSRVMHEAFTGSRIVKGYNLEKAVVDRFKANQAKFISHYMRVIRSTESPGPIIEVLGALGVAALLFYLGRDTSAVGSFLFIGSLVSMYSPVKSLVRLQSELATHSRRHRARFRIAGHPRAHWSILPIPCRSRPRAATFTLTTSASPTTASRSCATFNCASNQARRWPWWAKAVRAKPRWPTCCSAFTIRPAAPSASPAWICARRPCAICAARWRW